MTNFLGFVLLCVICDLTGVGVVLRNIIYGIFGLEDLGDRQTRPWWRYILSFVLAIVVAGVMMLSYWDWRP